MGRWIIALLLLPQTGHAQQVYKCTAPDGATVYQSHACESGSPEKTWDASPYRVDPQRQAQIDRDRRNSEARAAADRARRVPVQRVTSRAPTAEQGRHARCEAARRTRDQALERLGLRRTHADLRRWGDYVYQRCKP